MESTIAGSWRYAPSTHRLTLDETGAGGDDGTLVAIQPYPEVDGQRHGADLLSMAGEFRIWLWRGLSSSTPIHVSGEGSRSTVFV